MRQRMKIFSQHYVLRVIHYLSVQFSALANKMSSHISILVNLWHRPQNIGIFQKSDEGLETVYVDLTE